jgi:hypothetical protein
VEEEKPHPANYQGCRHTEEEMQKKKSQRTTMGRVFSFNLTTPGVLCDSASRQDRRTAAASDTSGGSGRFCHNRTQGPGGFTPK